VSTNRRKANTDPTALIIYCVSIGVGVMVYRIAHRVTTNILFKFVDDIRG
jgi:hypothetical protein